MLTCRPRFSPGRMPHLRPKNHLTTYHRGHRMRTNLVGLTLCLCALQLSTSNRAHAQPADVPQASPHARVEQHVGLGDFSVDYSSPAVKGRTIWGGLVAYDKPWRTGANAATKLTSD